MAIRVSIRYKILSVLGGLLLAAVGFYTLLASTIFRQEKIALLYDINHSVAVNVASQIRSTILQTSEQLKLYLFTQLSSQHMGKISEKSLKEDHVLGVEILKRENGKWILSSGLKTYPILNYEIEKKEGELQKAESLGYSVWGETSDPPRLFLATKVEVIEGKEAKNYLVVAEMERNFFVAPLQIANLFQSFLSNSKGSVLFSFEKSHSTSVSDVQEHPLLKKALGTQGSTSGVLSFSYLNQKWYGAYAPIGIADLYFLSQANQSEVTNAISVLIRQSFLFGLIVITLTFLASILFSKHLTQNLKRLNETTRVIGEGELTSRIAIRSGDEIEELAESFNRMMEALKAGRDAIEQYNRELEGKVAERTKELHEKNAAIKEVQEQLLKSTQLAAVGEVAGRTAHEVLNPLTAIIGRLEKTQNEVGGSRVSLTSQFAEILNAWEVEYKKGGVKELIHALETPSTVQPEISLFEEDLKNLKTLCQYWEEEHEGLSVHLQFVRKEAERIHRIVDKMRQLVRSSEVVEEVECHHLLKEAVSTLTDFFEKHGVELKLEWGAEKDNAKLNHDEFIQVITNLLRNAYQAIEMRTPKVEGHITVRTYNEADCLMIEIEDNGMGIEPEKQPMIFEHGFTTKSPTEGTGFGLSICRRYARAFGGEVELKSSTPNVNTVFVVRVPLLSGNLLKIAV